MTKLSEDLRELHEQYHLYLETIRPRKKLLADIGIELISKLEDLELDAERYRCLRNKELNTDKGGVFAGMIPENIVLNGIDLDEAVDTMIVTAIARKNETLYGQQQYR